MAKTEDVRKRLLDFIEAVRQKASGVGFQAQVGQPLPKRPLEQTLENCLAVLKDAERDELDRIIEKMGRALATR